MDLLFGKVDSPLGAILVACIGNILCAVEFADCADRVMAALRTRYGNPRLFEAPDPGCVCTRLRAYLRGAFDAVDDIELDGGGTPFQRKTWAELRRIPPGEVLTYSALAQRLEIPKACRAVGHANARNPISIVVPCHRIIGADGALTGYSGGLRRKRWLLEHEGVNVRSVIRHRGPAPDG